MSSTDFLATILADAGKAGVFHMPHTDKKALIAAAKASRLAAYQIDLAGVRDKAGLLAAIGKAMGFPSWYGHNLDALADCLGDLSWRSADGHLVLLEHCDGIQGAAADDFRAVLEVFGQTAADWRDQGVAFWCLIEMQADGIAWLPTEP
jgi:RNAse (barnase) inhibitor barstar